MHCPKCGDKMVFKNNSMYCERGNMLLTHTLYARFNARFVEKISEEPLLRRTQNPSVNMDTGELGPYAWKNFEWGGDRYIHHPDTGFKFAGFIVPHFEAAKEMVKSAAAFLPYRLVGWDAAITEKGPILIEGNHDFGFWGAQIADGGYKKNKAFRAFFGELTNK